MNLLPPITLLFLAAAAPAQIHVAPGGDDGGPGDAARPFATLARAQRAVRERRAAEPEEGVEVLLHEGVYRPAATLVFGPEDGGGEGAAVVWRAAPGARPVVSGGRVVRGLEAGADGVWRAPWPAGAGAAPPFRGVFLGGLRLSRARHPDAGWLRVAEVGPDRRSSFRLDPAALPGGPLDPGAEVLVLHDWSSSRIPVASLDRATGWLTTRAPIGCSLPFFALDNWEPHPRFALEGSRSFLDAPGEWHFDPAAGELLVRPPLGGEVGEGLEVAVLDQLLRVAGEPGRPVRGLRFEGIDFELCRFLPPSQGWAGVQAGMHDRREPGEGPERVFVPAAVSWSHAVDGAMVDLGLRLVDGSGIALGAGCERVELLRCTVEEAGANGIDLGLPGAQGALPRGLRVEGCLVRRCGRLYGGAVGVWVGFAEAAVIRGNEITELPYTGLSLGWAWHDEPLPGGGHLVERNHIHDVMRLLSDGGCIYTLGRQPGTVIRANHLHGVPRHAGRAPSNGVFVDQGSTELLLEGNWIHDVGHAAIRFHMSGENTLSGNLLEPAEGVPPYFFNATGPERLTIEGDRVGAEVDPGAAAAVARAAGRR